MERGLESFVEACSKVSKKSRGQTESHLKDAGAQQRRISAVRAACCHARLGARATVN